MVNCDRTAAPLQKKPLMRHGTMTTSATCL